MRYAFLIVALLFAGQLVAQQAVPTTPPQPTDPARRADDPGVQTRTDTTHQEANLAAQRGKDRIVRASQVIGINVKNKAGEDLGSINDLVIDPMDGRITYAAVSMGGFLGVGDKLFAVPWEAIECRKVEDQHVAVLDVNKQTLQNAKGFDQNNWPNFADEQWRMENDRPFRTAMRQRHEVYRPIQQPQREPQPGSQQPRDRQQSGTEQPGAQPLPAQPQQQ